MVLGGRLTRQRRFRRLFPARRMVFGRAGEFGASALIVTDRVAVTALGGPQSGDGHAVPGQRLRHLLQLAAIGRQAHLGRFLDETVFRRVDHAACLGAPVLGDAPAFGEAALFAVDRVDVRVGFAQRGVVRAGRDLGGEGRTSFAQGALLARDRGQFLLYGKEFGAQLGEPGQPGGLAGTTADELRRGLVPRAFQHADAEPAGEIDPVRSAVQADGGEDGGHLVVCSEYRRQVPRFDLGGAEEDVLGVRGDQLTVRGQPRVEQPRALQRGFEPRSFVTRELVGEVDQLPQRGAGPAVAVCPAGVGDRRQAVLSRLQFGDLVAQAGAAKPCGGLPCPRVRLGVRERRGRGVPSGVDRGLHRVRAVERLDPQVQLGGHLGVQFDGGGEVSAHRGDQNPALLLDRVGGLGTAFGQSSGLRGQFVHALPRVVELRARLLDRRDQRVDVPDCPLLAFGRAFRFGAVGEHRFVQQRGASGLGRHRAAAFQRLRRLLEDRGRVAREPGAVSDRFRRPRGFGRQPPGLTLEPLRFLGDSLQLPCVAHLGTRPQRFVAGPQTRRELVELAQPRLSRVECVLSLGVCLLCGCELAVDALVAGLRVARLCRAPT